jgi:hypothetical protein
VGRYLGKLGFHSFDGRTRELSFSKVACSSTYVVVNEFSKLDCSAGGKNAMDFSHEGIP